MPTLTETRLQTVLEKIKKLKALQQCPQGLMSPESIKKLVVQLQDIGNIVLQLPCQFKAKYSNIAWSDFENWVLFSTLCVRSETELRCESRKIFAAESEISRHANPNCHIEKAMAQSLRNTNTMGSSGWYANIQTTYLLVSLTLFIFLVRIQIPDIDISPVQVLFYLMNASYTLVIVVEIAWHSKFLPFKASLPKNYSSTAEFYDVEIEALSEIVENIEKRLKSRQTLRLVLLGYWIITYIGAIIITIRDA